MCKAKKIEWKELDNGCWECTSHARDFEGYPLKYYKGKLQRLSRVMYQMAYGGIPYNLKVMHTCDFRACINLAHLELGTSLENTQDMINKGRQNNTGRKLTKEQREAIIKDTRPKKEIVEEYGITRQDVHKIQSRGRKEMASWKTQDNRITKIMYERYLNDLGFPEGIESKCRQHKQSRYGAWLRRTDIIAFDVGYVKWEREEMKRRKIE